MQVVLVGIDADRQLAVDQAGKVIADIAATGPHRLVERRQRGAGVPGAGASGRVC